MKFVHEDLPSGASGRLRLHDTGREAEPLTRTANRGYVLVTAAKNEEVTIGRTLDAVIQQTRQPVEWVIVSDGSTDRTDEFVQAAEREHNWIRLVQLKSSKRSFASVVRALEAGIREVSANAYDFIGLLDADITFARGYFEQLMHEFQADPCLGLAGGVVIDAGSRPTDVPRNTQDVPGAVQFFRRTCFEELGDLEPIPQGGWDALTCAKVRFNGHRTKLLRDLQVSHLKARNISQGSLIRRTSQLGERDYVLGYHPIFEAFKCISRWRDEPFLIGAAAWGWGYCAAWLRQMPRHPIDPRLREFMRSEQLGRVRRLFGRSAGTGDGGLADG